jgi:hypothetical protein
MGLSRLKELVSQAEREGVSLGVMISRRMSPEEIEMAQMELAEELCANHVSIERFMADVKVPSIDEIIARKAMDAEVPDELMSDGEIA